jgi:hypothetical protein
MDDFNVSSLHESKNEWGARLVTILTPLVIDGYKSILEEAIKLCKENNEADKYLMTFQNFISRIPKWNATIIETEKKRICDKSGCSYLEDLVTCVHIIQLKILTAMRVGQKQKKIDINIPKLDDFIHKVYINVARKVYKNVYLFEVNIPPLQIQKHHRELEIIIQESILNTLRESIPVEAILKAYMDETVEEDVIEEIKEQIIDEPIKQKVTAVGPSQGLASLSKTAPAPTHTPTHTINETGSRLTFDDIDYMKGTDGTVTSMSAPKSIERLEEISNIRAEQRKSEEEDDDDNVKLKISDQSIELGDLDIHVIDEPRINLLPDLLIDDIEILE